MMRRTDAVITVACLLVSAGVRASDQGKDNGLRIYLPREIVIEANTPKLGQIGIINGDAGLVSRAEEIALGRIMSPGQELTIDRQMLLGRLAYSGIPASKVRLSGAERVKVRQKGHTIRQEEFVDAAKLYLSKNLPAGAICQSDPIRVPDDLTIEGVYKDIRLVPRMLSSGAVNQTRIQMSVMAGGKEIGRRQISFQHKYECLKVVTLSDIAAGATISPENVKVEKIISNYPAASDWSSPYGLITRRALAEGTVLQPNMFGPAKPAVLVKRNQSVVIQLEAGGLVVTAVGRMLDEGAAGDLVRVRNVDSQRVIIGKVNEDGTVEPVL
ncbi:MAG: flagellar basal body P-ring formation protein FlgA [Sedimentisphaerales bacterium]|nr:flagellar basal body P-ring formation protein FlgA [Sedimentisphaerales bacterium]